MESADIVAELVKLVFAILAPVLGGLAVALAAKALQKAGITLDAEKRAKLEHLAAQLVFQTEEWASSRIKAGIPVSAAQKAEYYVEQAAGKIPGVDSAEAHALAQQFLGRVRMTTAEVLRDVRLAAAGGK